LDKRGISMSVLVLIILALFFLLLAFFFMGGIGKNMLDTAKKNRCTQSIMRSSLDGIPNLKCDATYIKLNRDDLEARGDLNDELKRKIADMMLACWRLTGSGKNDPYRNSFEISRHLSNQIYLLCDIVEFENIRNFRGLEYWIAINKPASLKVSYYEALYGRQATPQELEELKKQDDTYDTMQRYVVAWRYGYDLNQTSLMEYPVNNVIFVPYTEVLSGTDLFLHETPVLMN
jgi:hypothetical protein